jgi:hypothetical protein
MKVIGGMSFDERENQRIFYGVGVTKRQAVLLG